MDSDLESMDAPGFAPLTRPPEWPFKKRSPLGDASLTTAIWLWPKRILKTWLASIRQRKQMRMIDIEITRQLRERPVIDVPPVSPADQVRVIIGQAVTEERGLGAFPRLHPADPIDVLFCDHFEGLIPMLVRWELKSQLGINESLEVIVVAIAEGWAVSRFVAEIVAMLQDPESNHQ